jgi:hypothetical protein
MCMQYTSQLEKKKAEVKTYTNISCKDKTNIKYRIVTIITKYSLLEHID